MLTTATSVLADSDVGKSGPLGLLMTLSLGVAVYFLYRSMNRHLKKIPHSFDEATDAAGSEQAAAPPGAGTAGAGTDSAGADGAGTDSAGADGAEGAAEGRAATAGGPVAGAGPTARGGQGDRETG